MRAATHRFARERQRVLTEKGKRHGIWAQKRERGPLTVWESMCACVWWGKGCCPERLRTLCDSVCLCERELVRGTCVCRETEQSGRACTRVPCAHIYTHTQPLTASVCLLCCFRTTVPHSLQEHIYGAFSYEQAHNTE
jgi:hypothetical protein